MIRSGRALKVCTALMIGLLVLVSCTAEEDEPAAEDVPGSEQPPPLSRGDRKTRPSPSPREPPRTDDPSGADCPECIADFAVYDPSYEDDGVWEEEVKALASMFGEYGWSYEKVGPEELNAGALGSGTSRKYRALIAPGGWAAYRNRRVSATGETAIRDFVASGGNFVGFCAGAYWAVGTVIWAQTATGGGGAYNLESDYTGEYPYDLGLFPGRAQGPLGWVPWGGGASANYEQAAIETGNGTMVAIGMPESTRFFYAGGPFFLPSGEAPPGYEVWATAIFPEGMPDEASTGSGQPTIVRHQAGEGDVILFSYHPEILVASSVDGVKLTRYYNEDAIQWNLGGQTQEEINLHGWNIVHAAMQIAANEEVTPVTSLP